MSFLGLSNGESIGSGLVSRICQTESKASIEIENIEKSAILARGIRILQDFWNWGK